SDSSQMTDSVSSRPVARTGRFDLGRNIGRPDWYVQLGLLAGLSLLTISLGFNGPSLDSPETAVPMQTAALSESDYMSMELPARRDLLPVEVLPIEKTVTVRSGDTLDVILQRAGVSPRESYEAVTALSAEYNPRRL